MDIANYLDLYLKPDRISILGIDYVDTQRSSRST